MRAWRLPVIVLSLLVVDSSAQAQSHQERIGDVMSVIVPAATLGTELLRGEREGAWQFTLTLATTLAATEVLKRTTHVERPDHSDDDSFPSRHAAAIFPAATYVHRRYGIEAAWPVYVAATYVGYTRVEADQHRWGDIAGAAVISAAAAWWLVEPKAGRIVAVMPMLGRKFTRVQVAAQW